jgi:putative DNA primase/helicase
VTGEDWERFSLPSHTPEDPEAKPSKKKKVTPIRDGIEPPDWAPPVGVGWVTTKQGIPKASECNILAVLHHHPYWVGLFAYDVLQACTVTTRASVLGEPSKLQDHMLSAMVVWLQNELRMDAKRSVLFDVVDSIAHENSVDSLKIYIDSLVWDGVPRIETFLIYYMQAEDTPLVRAFGSRWLISAVARALNPGCKVDCVLVFEGLQGKFKSTSLAILGGAWFTDASLENFGGKEAPEIASGKWIVELGELSGVGRSRQESTKAFVSRGTDRYRPAYGRLALDLPRRCVFAGTTNDDSYLTDPTGNRRWWPVRCNESGWSLDELRERRVVELTRDRDQIWAESVARYKAGEPWWLDTEELEEQQREATELRRQAHPWEEIIGEWLESPKRKYDSGPVSINRILSELLNVPSERQHQGMSTQIGKILQKFGWSAGPRTGSDSDRVRTYVKK